MNRKACILVWIVLTVLFISFGIMLFIYHDMLTPDIQYKNVDVEIEGAKQVIHEDDKLIVIMDDGNVYTVDLPSYVETVAHVMIIASLLIVIGMLVGFFGFIWLFIGD